MVKLFFDKHIMKDLIKKILKEEAEMTEMGISLSKLTASQPKNYLVRSLIKKEKSAEKKKEDEAKEDYRMASSGEG